MQQSQFQNPATVFHARPFTASAASSTIDHCAAIGFEFAGSVIIPHENSWQRGGAGSSTSRRHINTYFRVHDKKNIGARDVVELIIHLRGYFVC